MQQELFKKEEPKPEPMPIPEKAKQEITPEHWASLTEQEKEDVKWVMENL